MQSIEPEETNFDNSQPCLKKKVMHTLLWALSLLISSTTTCYLRETSNRGNVFSLGLSYTHLKLIMGERIALYASVYNIS